MAEKVVGNAYLVLENLCLLPTQFLLLIGRREKGQSGGSIFFYCANITKKTTADGSSFRLLQTAPPLSLLLLYHSLQRHAHIVQLALLFYTVSLRFKHIHTRTDLYAFLGFQYFGIGRLLLLFQFGL